VDGVTHSVEPAPLAYNNSFGEAFPDGIRGFNRPANVRLDRMAASISPIAGRVRDLGRSDPDAGFENPADAALVQIPGTGVI
jgi:hypothetical protein